MQNRRSATRHAVSLPGQLVANGVERTITVVDLSVGGARAALRTRRPLGTRVHLAFSIPTHQDPIVVGATVRWTDQSTAGLEFDELNANEVWALNRYFEQLSSSD